MKIEGLTKDVREELLEMQSKQTAQSKEKLPEQKVEGTEEAAKKGMAEQKIDSAQEMKKEEKEAAKEQKIEETRQSIWEKMGKKVSSIFETKFSQKVLDKKLENKHTKKSLADIEKINPEKAEKYKIALGKGVGFPIWNQEKQDYEEGSGYSDSFSGN